jgi:D-galactose 1-dehydrogenase
MAEARIGIIGYGKIAQDQHLPSIRGNPAFRLAGTTSRSGAGAPDVPTFKDWQEMLHSVELDAVAICTPPGPRHDIARGCLEAGLDVLLEKPPGNTLGDVEDLNATAERHGRCLFTTWHAQFNEPVQEAAAIVRREGLRSMSIRWLEDVEKWHPGQQWIWEAGGFGVFDAGINALSIATSISPAPLLVQSAEFTLHDGGQQPIAATLAMRSPGASGPIEARLDWRQKGDERWEIDIVTAAGTSLSLSEGGALLVHAGAAPTRSSGSEYAQIYARFAALIAARQSHVDTEPLRLVADAYMLASRSLPAQGER